MLSKKICSLALLFTIILLIFMVFLPQPKVNAAQVNVKIGRMVSRNNQNDPKLIKPNMFAEITLMAIWPDGGEYFYCIEVPWNCIALLEA
jgi:hypothetical protein